MKIAGTVNEGMCLITLEGQVLGGPEAMQLKEIVRDNLSKGVHAFMINMSEAEWFNSTGLGILISCLKVIREADGSLALFDIHEKVMGLLTITKLVMVFNRFDTQQEAEAFLRQKMATK